MIACPWCCEYCVSSVFEIRFSAGIVICIYQQNVVFIEEQLCQYCKCIDTHIVNINPTCIFGYFISQNNFWKQNQEFFPS
jgi:hypothetical protein